MSYYEYKECIEHSWSRPVSPFTSITTSYPARYDYNDPCEYVAPVNNYASSSLLDSSCTKLTATGADGSSKIEICYETEIEEQTSGKRVYRATFFVDDFTPNDMQVKTEDESLIVCGNRCRSIGNTVEKKHFYRKLPMPNMVDVNRMCATYYGNGRLIVEAPICGYSAVDKQRYGYRIHLIRTVDSNNNRNNYCDEESKLTIVDNKHFYRKLPMPNMVDMNRLRATYYGIGRLIVEEPIKGFSAVDTQRNGNRVHAIGTVGSNNNRNNFCDEESKVTVLINGRPRDLYFRHDIFDC